MKVLKLSIFCLSCSDRCEARAAVDYEVDFTGKLILKYDLSLTANCNQKYRQMNGIIVIINSLQLILLKANSF
jgi:hypothetical protein